MKGLLIMPVSYSKTAVFHNLFTVGEGRADPVRPLPRTVRGFPVGTN